MNDFRKSLNLELGILELLFCSDSLSLDFLSDFKFQDFKLKH